MRLKIEASVACSVQKENTKGINYFVGSEVVTAVTEEYSLLGSNAVKV